jgi:hypothetical protein
VIQFLWSGGVTFNFADLPISDGLQTVSSLHAAEVLKILTPKLK